MALLADRLPSTFSSKSDPSASNSAHSMTSRNIIGKRVAMVLFSYYPTDPRPRRAAEALVSFGMSVELICVKEGSHEATREVVNAPDVPRCPVERYPGRIFAYCS